MSSVESEPQVWSRKRPLGSDVIRKVIYPALSWICIHVIDLNPTYSSVPPSKSLVLNRCTWHFNKLGLGLALLTWRCSPCLLHDVYVSIHYKTPSCTIINISVSVMKGLCLCVCVHVCVTYIDRPNSPIRQNASLWQHYDCRNEYYNFLWWSPDTVNNRIHKSLPLPI